MNLGNQKHDEWKLRPADIFGQGVRYLFGRLEPLGYKLLKSNTIKKKQGPAVCEIQFYSSHDNNIDITQHFGSVKMQVVCHILLDREIIYQFRFTRPMDQTCWFEILTDDSKLDKARMDFIGDSINAHFLAVVKGLEENPLSQLASMELNQETQAPDYTWMIIMARSMVMFYGNEQLLRQYDLNCEKYGRMELVIQRSLKEYQAYALDLVNRKWCLAQQPEVLLGLMDKVFLAFRFTDGNRDRLKAKYHLVQSLDSSDLPAFVTAVYWFLAEIGSDSHRWEEEPELVREVEKIYHNLFHQNKTAVLPPP